MTDPQITTHLDVLLVATDDLITGSSLDSLPENLAWIVYSYHRGNHEGSGEAILGYANNTFNFASLGHCSCNGPTDRIPDEGIFTEEEILERFGKNPNGGSLTPGEWDTNAYLHIWTATIKLGLISPTKETARMLLNVPSRAAREYAICHILPKIKDRSVASISPKAKTALVGR